MASSSRASRSIRSVGGRSSPCWLRRRWIGSLRPREGGRRRPVLRRSAGRGRWFALARSGSACCNRTARALTRRLRTMPEVPVWPRSLRDRGSGPRTHHETPSRDGRQMSADPFGGSARARGSVFPDVAARLPLVLQPANLLLELFEPDSLARGLAALEIAQEAVHVELEVVADVHCSRSSRSWAVK